MGRWHGIQSVKFLGNCFTTQWAAGLEGKQDKSEDCSLFPFLLVWPLVSILSVHKKYNIKIAEMFPQILSKPSSSNGMIPVCDSITGKDQSSGVCQGSLCVADFILGLKELKAAHAKVVVNHFYICLCLPALLGRTVCSQLH